MNVYEHPDRSDGGQPGNQNARRHGWTSRTHPTPIADILAAADAAVARGDLATLRKAERALRFRNANEEAHAVRQAIEIAHFAMGEREEPFSGPSSVVMPCADDHAFEETVGIEDGTMYQTADISRIVRGKRPTHGRSGSFPYAPSQ